MLKVLLVNGSPHPEGNTFIALCEVAAALNAEDVATEIFPCGRAVLRGCQGCGGCASLDNRCVYDDEVNVFLEKTKGTDGFIFGSPVHYAGVTGALKSFMDRCFYAGRHFAYKPAAGVVVARRGGETPAFDQLNKYFQIAKMPVVSSQYWNMVFGQKPGEARQDAEGLQTMRLLGRNMAWLLKCIQAGAGRGITPPEPEAVTRMNYIR